MDRFYSEYKWARTVLQRTVQEAVAWAQWMRSLDYSLWEEDE